VSTVTCTECSKPGKTERVWEHGDCGCPCHQLPGERERIAFHFHQFKHGCYGERCPESERLYAAWQDAAASTR
jgi:hypothetical protein